MLSTLLPSRGGAKYSIIWRYKSVPLQIVARLSLPQPSVSKHLRVLRDVGLVHLRCEGRRKLYRLNADAIRPLHEWTSTFERFWRNQLRRVKERAEGKMNIA
jgi:DNA-binding transcriptional ArsR family regulator